MTHLISSIPCVNAPVFFRGFAFFGKEKFNRSSEKADLPAPDAMSDSAFRPSVRQCLYVRKPALFMCHITPFMIDGDSRGNSFFISDIPRSHKKCFKARLFRELWYRKRISVPWLWKSDTNDFFQNLSNPRIFSWNLVNSVGSAVRC